MMLVENFTPLENYVASLLPFSSLAGGDNQACESRRAWEEVVQYIVFNLINGNDCSSCVVGGFAVMHLDLADNTLYCSRPHASSGGGAMEGLSLFK